jgi:hypothetical protein
MAIVGPQVVGPNDDRIDPWGRRRNPNDLGEIAFRGGVGNQGDSIDACVAWMISQGFCAKRTATGAVYQRDQDYKVEDDFVYAVPDYGPRRIGEVKHRPELYFEDWYPFPTVYVQRPNATPADVYFVVNAPMTWAAMVWAFHAEHFRPESGVDHRTGVPFTAMACPVRFANFVRLG